MKNRILFTMIVVTLFAACSSDNEHEDVQPPVEPQQREVTSRFLDTLPSFTAIGDMMVWSDMPEITEKTFRDSLVGTAWKERENFYLLDDGTYDTQSYEGHSGTPFYIANDSIVKRYINVARDLYKKTSHYHYNTGNDLYVNAQVHYYILSFDSNLLTALRLFISSVDIDETGQGKRTWDLVVYTRMTEEELQKYEKNYPESN